MEAVAPRATWLSLLGPANAVADQDAASVACHNAQLTVENGRLTARATDLVRSYTGSRPLTAGKPGGACVNAKLFEKVVKAMPEGEVIVKVNDRTATIAHLSAPRKGSKIGTTPAEDHPSHPSVSGKAVTIPLATLHEVLRLVQYAQSNDVARAHLTATAIEWSGTTLRTIATDGHRLATATAQVPTHTVTTLIPRVAVEILTKLPATGDVTLSFTTDFVAWTVGDDQWTTKTMIDAFPSWQQVVPSSREACVSVDRLSLLASLRAVSTMTADRTNGVKFEATSESLSLRSEDPETGKMDDSIPCERRGTLPVWGLNAAYLIDVLNAYAGPKVELWLTGELDPLVVCDPSLGDRAVAVIMPMRI